MRRWAFWRRAQYISGIVFLFACIGTGLYFGYAYERPTCFDGNKNGDERGVDCGGSCSLVCALDVRPPTTLWAQSFRVTSGQYNAVAYVENTNQGIGAPSVGYTFTLYDAAGVITSRSGTTVLPPDSVYPIFEGRITTGTRVPTRTTFELHEGADWLPASAGREQFVLESRELRSIDTQPRLHARMTNTALTAARDVEIVATIFDANRNPLTASQTFVQHFPSRTTQEVIFTWPEPIAKTIRSCEAPTDVVLAIDLSGSMNDDGREPPEPVSSVLAAAGAFIGRLNANDQASVVTYATNAQVRRELTSDKAVVSSTIANLYIDAKEETGSTNIGDALKAAQVELMSDRHDERARKVVVLLTDGRANAPGNEPEQYARDAAAALKATEVEIFAIGLGTNINDAFLKEVSSGAGYAFRAASAGTIDQIYRQVTSAICEDGAAIIEIVPKTDTGFEDSRS